MQAAEGSGFAGVVIQEEEEEIKVQLEIEEEKEQDILFIEILEVTADGKCIVGFSLDIEIPQAVYDYLQDSQRRLM